MLRHRPFLYNMYKYAGSSELTFQKATCNIISRVKFKVSDCPVILIDAEKKWWHNRLLCDFEAVSLNPTIHRSIYQDQVAEMLVKCRINDTIHLAPRTNLRRNVNATLQQIRARNGWAKYVARYVHGISPVRRAILFGPINCEMCTRARQIHFAYKSSAPIQMVCCCC